MFLGNQEWLPTLSYASTCFILKTIDANQSIGQTVEEFIIIAAASFENEYQDRIEFLLKA
ncbi:MAG: hypothetical protein PUP92_23695 [Rhizonema sp. PD38]|nr:hypothetical protein [Rhizonema sp. PD38]